ncbi:MAG: putative transcriptional regulator with an addtional conserved domain [Herbinix sp.]|jgi:Zn-dependent peptidase ImmA (M78 family)/DNA-binding XRE family transcriptional regulator|nr:putative transcriptional regulator with an addtional conserved domain [Herbinix sp.]
MDNNELKIIPNRIKQARVSRGYSMGELADLAGVTKQAISQYEMGKTAPSAATLNRISDVLNYPVSFFRKEMPTNKNANSAVFFRSRKTTSAKAYAASKEKISIFREIHDYLCKYVSFPDIQLPKIDYTDIYHEISDKQIEDYANQLRNHWQLGNGPIENLTAVLQKNGIMISVMDLNNQKIDAFSVWYDSVPYVFLSSDKPSNARIRFDIAHELGHLLMHADNFSDDDVDKKIIHDKLEYEANVFAGAFLMPEESFSKDVYSTSIDHFIQLKKKWNVSLAAMIYRCESLDLLSANQIKYLKDQMTYKVYWKKEPLDDVIPIEKPFAHRQAFDLILENKITTPYEIIENIGCSAEEIEKYSFLDPGTLKIAIPNNIIQLKF